MGEKASEAAIARMRKFVEKYCEKSCTTTHPDREVTESVIFGACRKLRDAGQAALSLPFLSRQGGTGETSHLDLRMR